MATKSKAQELYEARAFEALMILDRIRDKIEAQRIKVTDTYSYGWAGSMGHVIELLERIEKEAIA
jgi:hypothetical protein